MARWDRSRRPITLIALGALLAALLALYACNFGGDGIGAPEVTPQQLEPPDLSLGD